MKKIIHIISFLLLSLPQALAQNNFVYKMNIPAASRVLAFETNKIKDLAIPLKRSLILPEAGQVNNFSAFISGLPEIKPKGIFNKKKISLITELSFSDMLENTFNSINTELINAYDETIPELYKDAPFLFKLKFLIRL